MLAVLWSLVVFKGQACLTAHYFSITISLNIDLMYSLASILLLLITEDKGGPTHGHKIKIQFCSMEAGTSCFTIFGKDASG